MAGNSLSEKEATLLRRAIALAQLGRDRGCHPFGSLLADESGNIRKYFIFIYFLFLVFFF